MTEPAKHVVVPPVPALLPAYLGRVDPVAELRAACRTAVRWLVDGAPSPVIVLADEPDSAARSRGVEVSLGVRVARSLLADVGYEQEIRTAGGGVSCEPRLLVLANGSARRGEKAPGHLDPRSFGFDERVETALAEGDPAGLATLDPELGHDLLAVGVEPLRQLGAAQHRVETANLLYAGDPYGVRYWVATWRCAPGG
jgi:hypothetical protein